ncbi:MAG TPA: glycosyltransferase [Pyrinomonadaceae bacterium]|jgi:glycosyltransferase involved in cell wall biosynthesis|nr:glycosyltransferase [Pyrinomonadaceae bacterium]
MLEPLGQTQVLPYLRQLAERGVKFTLLSFEKPRAFTAAGQQACEALKQELGQQGIEWHWLRYHQRPSLPATVFDVIQGIRYAGRLVKRNKIELVHARSHIPATIALALKRKFGIKMIFDVRGLMAEEYVDARHWPEGGLRYRVTKTTERRIFAVADGIVTLTERIWPIIKEWEGLKGRDVPHAVIPCCVDLSLFKFDEAQRAKLRAELNLGERLTMVYSGSLDGWYLTEEMVDFYAGFVRKRDDAHLLWLTTGSHERVRQLMSARGIGEDHFSVRAVTPKEIPGYLVAGDIGISFIKRCLSKLASSPTKNGEYLACGLPIVINAGVGDSDALADESRAAILIRDFNELDFDAAWTKIEEVVSDPNIRTRARELAEKVFDLESVGGERYAQLYEAVFLQD